MKTDTTQLRTAEKLNSVRFAYGLLWHHRGEDGLVHQARRTLLAWLDDKDQQRIGIEEAQEFIKKNMPPSYRYDPYLDGP